MKLQYVMSVVACLLDKVSDTALVQPPTPRQKLPAHALAIPVLSISCTVPLASSSILAATVLRPEIWFLIKSTVNGCSSSNKNEGSQALRSVLRKEECSKTVFLPCSLPHRRVRTEQKQKGREGEER